MTTISFIHLIVSLWLIIYPVAALPYLKFLMPSIEDEISSLVRQSVDSLDAEFEVLMNGILSSSNERSDHTLRFSESPSPASRGEHMYQETEVPFVSLFQESWRYEDYMRDWYDDEEDQDVNEDEDETEYHSET